MTGFGWSFYGFFVVAALWVAAYFAWAWRASRSHPRCPEPGAEHPRPEA